jgi:TRAP-type C4-dicarboxylate transport system permease small subunit
MTDTVEEMALQDASNDGFRFGPVGAALEKLATAFALAGGLIFFGLIVMSLVSIVGRKLFASPVQGDFEIVMMGAAVGSAAFLPLCALRDHNIRVEIATEWLPAGARSFLDGCAQLLITFMAAMMVWRTALQTMLTKGDGEESQLLAIPSWIPLALLLPSLSFLVICTAYRAVVAFNSRGSTP